MTYVIDRPQDHALQALGDPTRRAIFELLAARPRPVGELAAELPVSRPAVSQHLAILRAARLVTDRRDGVRRIYSIDPEGVAAMREYFDRFWNRALADFKQAAEHPTGEHPKAEHPKPEHKEKSK